MPKLLPDPINGAAPEEEMAATSHLPPHRWRKAQGSILMLHKPPPRMLLSDQIHVEGLVTSARAQHRDEPVVT